MLIVPPDLLEDAIGVIQERVGSLRPRDHLAVCLVMRALGEGEFDHLEAEETSLLLLASPAAPDFRKVALQIASDIPYAD